MPVHSYLELSLLMLVAIAAINDLATRRIPNRLLLAGWALAVPLHLLSALPGAAIVTCLGGAATGLLVFLPLYLLRGTAAGDVKLMATVGAFVGPGAAFQIAMLSWCAGGVMAVCIIVKNGRVRRALAKARVLLRPLLLRAAGLPAAQEPPAGGSVGSMPYGVAIALGTVIALLGRT
jgi:prepilin peptidase CpaA